MQSQQNFAPSHDGEMVTFRNSVCALGKHVLVHGNWPGIDIYFMSLAEYSMRYQSIIQYNKMKCHAVHCREVQRNVVL